MRMIKECIMDVATAKHYIYARAFDLKILFHKFGITIQVSHSQGPHFFGLASFATVSD